MAATPPRRLIVAEWRRIELIRNRLTRIVFTSTARTGLDGLNPETVTQQVLAGQRTVVRSVDVSLAAMAAVTVPGAPAAPVGLDAEQLIGARARNGTPLEEVYSRPGKIAREDGFEAGVAYLRQAIATDVQLAQRYAANAIVETDRRIVRWRRQTNPVPGGETCGLCVVAATQTYRKSDLQPIHYMCRCTVYPVYSTQRVDTTYDRDALSAVYDRSDGATDRNSLGRIRFSADDLPPGLSADALVELEPRVVSHPELGPFLTGRRHDTAVQL